jgi:hypothetical protein
VLADVHVGLPPAIPMSQITAVTTLRTTMSAQKRGK